MARAKVMATLMTIAWIEVFILAAHDDTTIISGNEIVLQASRATGPGIYALSLGATFSRNHVIVTEFAGKTPSHQFAWRSAGEPQPSVRAAAPVRLKRTA